MLEAAIDALAIISDPTRLALVICGALLGLLIGVIPGIGGLVGLSLLLPFTFSMDAYTALAFLVGVLAVTTTSDTIPAVLFGVPGTTGSAATVLDGHPMARRGEAGRAYGAAFTASVFGGLFGALVLALSIPILRPFVLAVGTPQLLAICLLGLTLVVALSQGALLKGLAAAALGLLFAAIGDEPQTGELRWTYGSFYLWDGLSLVPVALGLFAVPEMIDLGASKRRIARDRADTHGWQQLKGVRDVFHNWWLVLRCSTIGTLLGSIPGVGANVIDWIAYGYAAKSVKNSAETFGKGDVRGVIASESSNNAKEGGALVPTLAFGVPGSASMAILLGAFLIHGVAPGPDMLGARLDVTYTLIWTVAIANIFGAGACFLLAGHLARITMIRAGILVPLVMGVMVIGAYQGARDYADLLVLVTFGLLGWVMKRLGWPRPPLILAFVLGGLIENYLFISQLRYGLGWMVQPVPLALLSIAVLMLLGPLVARLVRGRAGGPVAAEPTDAPLKAPRGETTADGLLWLFFAAVFVYVLYSAGNWELPARMLPQAVAVAGLSAAVLFLATSLVSGDASRPRGAEPLALVLRQVAWLLGLVAAVRLVGMFPAIAVFMLAYMTIEGRTHWLRALLIVAPFLIGLILLFHHALNVPWPMSLLGDIFPALRRASGRLL